MTDDARKHQDIDTLARTLWGESRGESRAGRMAVANVVMNRVAVAAEHRKTFGTAYWWGSTVHEVCRKEWQFSCWLTDDPNRAKMERVDGTDAAFRDCLEIAKEAIEGRLQDNTEGATNYMNETAVRQARGGKLPGWVKSMTETVTIGAHTFYRSSGVRGREGA